MRQRAKYARLVQGVALALTVLLTACASPGPRERQAARLAEVESVAGEPVESFNFWDMQRWEVLGPLEVMVWTRVNEAWLLRVDTPCPGLEFANVIGVTSTQNRVSRRFDAVRFERQRCPIREIRPVDGKALKALRRAQD